MTPTSYILCSLIQIQSSRLCSLFNVAEQLACLSGVCQRNGTTLSKRQDGTSDVGVQCFFSPGLTVITVLEKTVAAMPLRKESKAILASDINSTTKFEIRGKKNCSHSCRALSFKNLLNALFSKVQSL